MGTELTGWEMELYRRVDEVLHYIWDPAGIAGIPQARNEYYGYLPTVYGLVKAGAAAEDIARHLEEVADDRMGVRSPAGRCAEIAHMLLEWREVLRNPD
ncbi:hypothetical protein [Uliginosibacterium sp. H1]|uniref:hypothetical protein n=1 Tax=Uliginosibacterium sp. H1 TaxID=3114757 RepID=UPI002E1971BB|nr:hypothetical protein [Uliginosibacterium sp. H1]